MTTNFLTFILLILSLISITSLFVIISQKIKNSPLKKCFLYSLLTMIVALIGLNLQCLLGYKLDIPLIYYDYFVYIGNCFLPLTLFFTSLIFVNTKLEFKKRYIPLIIVPFISLLVLWTNDFHHLFYEKYSINLDETIFGPYDTIYEIYTYSLFVISIFNLLRYSIKNAGFFSKQSILIAIGVLLPITVNILGSFGIFKMSIYLTPISITFSMLCFALAIFKFKFLSVTPIAMQRIVDRMSDSFLVVNEEGIITDFNSTFLKTFNLKYKLYRFC